MIANDSLLRTISRDSRDGHYRFRSLVLAQADPWARQGSSDVQQTPATGEASESW